MTDTLRPDSFEIKASELISRLHRQNYHGLAGVLDPQALAVALQSPNTYKPHPVAALVRADGSIGNDHGTQVLGNVDRAIRACRIDSNHSASAWVNSRFAAACRDTAFENAASALGEVRAFGYLWSADFTPKPVRITTSPTRDFDVALDQSVFGVEVHSKQMNMQEARKFASTARQGTTVVYPAGLPRGDESTAENVASKFAQIKPRARQAATQSPTILWLDLQDSDWWPISGSHADPAVVHQGEFYSGGLWHAMYGTTGTPLFEGHSVQQRVAEGVPRMAHPGLFEQSPSWSGVVLSMIRATIFFQNPNAPFVLPEKVVEALPGLPWFDFTRSRMDWPDGSLTSRLDADRNRLSELEKRARFRW